jgi:hypothetical protein
MKVDALGNPIKLGRTYGYSVDCNGITTTTTGIATSINDKSITLCVVSRLKGLYSDNPETDTLTNKKVSVKPMKLFPLNDVITGEDLFDKNFLAELGFEVTEDNGVYGKAQSLRPKGKILISWNREGAHCDYFGTPNTRKNAFMGIKEDAGTRSTFNGIVYTREQIELLINLSC